MTRHSDPTTHSDSEPPVAVIILVSGSAEAAIQLFENVLTDESNVVIVGHISKPLIDERIKIDAWIRATGAPVLLNEQSLHTRHGHIAHAIVSTVSYALANTGAERFLLLPFNCVKVVSGFGEEVRRGPLRYEGVRVSSAKRNTTMGGFRRSICGRRALVRRFGASRIYKGQHEGVVFDRAVARKLAAFKLPESKRYYDFAGVVARWSHLVIRLFPFAYEEFLVPTAVADGVLESGVPKKDPICYLDWSRKKHPPGFDELPWGEIPGEAFFYKWVPIESENENRRSLFRALPIRRGERVEGTQMAVQAAHATAHEA